MLYSLYLFHLRVYGCARTREILELETSVFWREDGVLGEAGPVIGDSADLIENAG